MSNAGGRAVLKNTWNVNRPSLGLQCVHLAQKAFDAALELLHFCATSSVSLSPHINWNKKAFRCRKAILTSRLSCYRALWMIDEVPAEGTAAMAERFTQMACQDAVWQAMNVLGAMGLSREARIEEGYRDIRMIAISMAPNEILTFIDGRELTGTEALRATGSSIACKPQ